MKILKTLELKGNRLVTKASPNVYNLARIVRNAIDKVYIEINYYLDKPFILIYQGGRVASTSVFESISILNLPNPLFHVHVLNLDGIESLETLKILNKTVDRNLFVGKMLGEKILERKKKKNRQINKWKIISIFREPISTMISLQFLNAEVMLSDLIDQDGNPDPDMILSHLHKMMCTDDTSNWQISKWFENEFYPAINIDVYNYPFDRDQGFTIIRDKYFDVLLLRFEDLNITFKKGVSQLLSISEDSVNLLRSNIHKNDRYAQIHKYVAEHLNLPESVCENIYSSKYIKHFYSQELIDSLIQKWAGY